MSRAYIPQLDGVRALAILFVLIAHSAPAFAGFAARPYLGRFGSPGVQIFFVLSGYLITGILLAAKGRPNYFRNFFARRGLRIWPLYYLVVLGCMLSGFVHIHGLSWWPYFLYISNLVYTSHSPQPAPFGPLWSLAVEEQFYIVWPLIVWFLPKRYLRIVCVVTLIAVPLLRALAPFDVHSTVFQIDALACGALLASFEGHLQKLRGLAWCVVWVLAIASPNQTVQVYGGAALLILALDSTSIVARFLRNSALRYVGRISYGIYLMHVLIFDALATTPLRRLLTSGSWEKILLYQAILVGCSIGVASLSFRFFEAPILRFKRYFETPSRVEQEPAETSVLVTAG